LRHGFAVDKPIQSRHERVLQRGGNRQWRQWPGQRIVLRPRLEPVRLQHRPGQLFHKQRHAVGFADDLLDHLGWQGFAARHPLDHLPHLGRR
jgi:hypothetical protein